MKRSGTVPEKLSGLSPVVTPRGAVSPIRIVSRPWSVASSALQAASTSPR